MYLSRISKAITLMILLVEGSRVGAATSTTTMLVTATPLSTCTVAATPLAFGTFSQVAGSPTDSTATINVTCSQGTTFNVGLDQGLHASGGMRQMQAATSTSLLPYALYSDATRTTAWGNTVNSNTVAGTAAVTPTALTVYGRIPASSSLAQAGAYSDTVTVTVTF